MHESLRGYKLSHAFVLFKKMKYLSDNTCFEASEAFGLCFNIL